MKVKALKSIISKQEINSRLAELGKEIDVFYNDEPLVVIGVLKGAFVFLSDLVRNINSLNVEVDFVRVASYGYSECSAQSVNMSKDIELDINGKHVLLVEDIIDTGHSLHYLYDLFSKRGALSLRTAVFLDKKERREVKVQADFIAFTIESGFVVGYGLDFAERFRQLPEVCIVEFE